jgi:hypothetical protein
MKSFTRKGLRLGLVAGLVATGLVGVTSLTAAGSGGSSTVHYGTLTIELTDRAGSLKLALAPGFGGGTFTQALSVSTPCSTLVAGPVVPAGTGSGNLLDFRAATGGSAPNVQLPSNGIGVTDGANCGDPAGLIGPGETLTLDLGGFLPADVTVGSGTLQIGKSRGNDGDVRVAYDGGNFGPARSVAVGVDPVTVADTDGKFKSISIRSTATQSSRGLSLQSSTEFTLMAPAQATVPGAPTNVTALRGNAQATVSWAAPASDGGSAITRYMLLQSANSGPWVPATIDPATAAQTTQTATGLTNGTPYSFRVAAVNGVGIGLPSDPSASVIPATVPGAPTGITADRGNGQATVSWGVPLSTGGSAITGYVLQYSPTGATTTTTLTVGPGISSETVTGLTNGTEYTFEVRAVNDVGAGAPASSAVIPATLPDAPTGVTAIGGTAEATVEWGDPLSDGGSQVTGYELQYSDDGGSTWAPEAPLTATSPQTVTGLADGIEYTFRVRAVNAVGSGPWAASNTVVPTSKEVDCGETVPKFGDLEDGDIATSAVFLRGENSTKVVGDPTTCTKVNATVAIVTNGQAVNGGVTDYVYWDNDTLDGNAQVNATITIAWAPIDLADAWKPTLIDYDGYETAGGFVDAQWCLSFTEETGPNGEIIYTGELPFYDGPGANDDDTAPWCLVKSDQELRGDKLFRTEVFFGSGDPLSKTR